MSLTIKKFSIIGLLIALITALFIIGNKGTIHPVTGDSNIITCHYGYSEGLKVKDHKIIGYEGNSSIVETPIDADITYNGIKSDRIETLIINSSLVDYDAIVSNSIKEIYIRRSVEYINYGAFLHCNKDLVIYCENSKEETLNKCDMNWNITDTYHSYFSTYYDYFSKIV